MNILGVKTVLHDTGAALISNGKVIAISEERLNRSKKTSEFPKLSIAYCLDAFGLKPEDIDVVAMGNVPHYDHPRLEKLFREYTAGAFTRAQITTVNHHAAHAASAFFCSPFEEAAILVYDGAGELFTTHHGIRAVETETLYRGTGIQITQIQKTLQPQDAQGKRPYTFGLGMLYAFFSRDYLAFGRHNEGKMMGLAAYGDDRFLKEFPYERWVGQRAGQLVCNGNISFRHGGTVRKVTHGGLVKGWRIVRNALRYRLRTSVNRLFSFATSTLVRKNLRGMVVKPDLFEPVVMPRPARDPATQPLPDTFYSSVAYAAQKIFERFATELGVQLHSVTQSDNLCIAGGCGLNIDANLHFLTRAGFKNIFVQPAASDAGLPLGCALWAAHQVARLPRTYEMKTVSLGRPYRQEEILSAIKARSTEIVFHRSDAIASEVAKYLADGKIIGWFQGGSEYGPRALGNRSILCDARRAEMKDILNNRVKHREPWRPFAASILAQETKHWFALPVESPFMLLAGQVVENKRKLVPSIVHVDGSCRVQSVTKEQNVPYFELLTAFHALTGVPLVLNTSFNLGGEPIVESPADALDTFLRTNMDYLILHHYVIAKKP